ncbi:MAG: GtrA family protein [Lachnospiraceae bacterium]|nr:GtrA family protein [Lachnospiraceae bacterium]
MRKLLEQILKFGIVGVIAFVVDFGIFTVLSTVLDIHYLIANFFGFSVSVVVNYLLSMRYVFTRQEGANKKAEFVIFVILSVVGLVLNEWIIYLCVDVIYESWTALHVWISHDLAKLTGKIIATGIVMVYNFITRKLFIEKGFRK